MRELVISTYENSDKSFKWLALGDWKPKMVADKIGFILRLIDIGFLQKGEYNKFNDLYFRIHPSKAQNFIKYYDL